MRIVQFMASAGYGGAEKVFVELSNWLSARHQVTALVPRRCAYLHRFSSDVRVVELMSHPTSNNPFLHFELYSVLKHIRPDIIHTHGAKGAMLVNRVNRFLACCHLATKHNDRKGRIFNKLRWVSAVSHKGRESVRSTVGGEVRVIVNGLHPEPVGERNIPENFTILAVGRLDRIKGFDILLREASKFTFPFDLQIVGEGPEEGELKRLAAAMDLENKVSFPGFVENIPQMMKNADIVVISSHREGCPKVMVESFFYAPLLMATRVGDIPDLLPESLLTTHETLAVDMERAVANYGHLRADFEGIREQRKDLFSMASVAKAYEQYYEDVKSHSS